MAESDENGPRGKGTDPSKNADAKPSRKKATRKKTAGGAAAKPARKKAATASSARKKTASSRATRKKASASTDEPKPSTARKKTATRKTAARKTATTRKATSRKTAAASKPATRKKASPRKKAARKTVAEHDAVDAEHDAVDAQTGETEAAEATRVAEDAQFASEADAEAPARGPVEVATDELLDDLDEEPPPVRTRRRRMVRDAPAAAAPDKPIVGEEALDELGTASAELEAQADAVGALSQEEEEEDLGPELVLPEDLGPVFEGEVPLDTPEERLAAMRKAAARLGIQRLHPEQEEVIDAVLSGQDTLMVLPTGFGKSACYQIPSMVLSKPVLVISPLLALMRDQYDKLERLRVPCVKIDGTVRGGARKRALERVASGERLLVMTTPETLGAPDAAEALAQGGVAMAAVDEAHCISEWGYDFRPAYLQIGERLRAVGAPPVLSLTATATEKVRLAIQRFVGMRDTKIVASSPHRENLAFDVLHCGGGARHRALARLALRVRRPGIIYCSTTREVDEMYTVLQRFGIPSHRYHGKMTGAERGKSQDSFMQRGRRTVMVATNAFGLGIDKPDIRYVMHYQSPASLEQYVQEAGRAGRDGRRANCIMLYSHEDRAVHEALLSRSRVRPEQLYKLGKALAAWAHEDKVPSLAALALSAELGARTTGALLALMEEAELVRWDQTAVYVMVPPDEIEARSRTLAGQFETLRTQDARRLDAVSEYATTPGCRAVFLRDYFGEIGGEDCGMCDRCRGQEDRPSSFWQPLAPPRGENRRGRRKGGSGRGRSQAGQGQGQGRGRKTRGRKRRGGRRSASGEDTQGEARSSRRRPARGDRNERAERPNRGDRATRPDRPNRGEQTARGSEGRGAGNGGSRNGGGGNGRDFDAQGSDGRGPGKRRRRGRRGGRGRRPRKPESEGPSSDPTPGP